MVKDEYPLEVYEVYEVIEKLLSPDEKIYESNNKSSNCILMMLDDLHQANGNAWKSANQLPKSDGIYRVFGLVGKVKQQYTAKWDNNLQCWFARDGQDLNGYREQITHWIDNDAIPDPV